MSEPIPESIPTSADRRSHRPTKKRALTPASAQADQVEALFANPDKEITLPNGSRVKQAAAPPEIVANVQGSSAGAGSGEFHVYKASRRREYERLRLMDEEVAKEETDRAYAEKQEASRKADEEKLARNRAKRDKAKARKQKGGKDGGDGAMDVDAHNKPDGQTNGVKKKLGPAKVAFPSDDAREEQEAVGENGQIEAREQEVGITIHDDD